MKKFVIISILLLLTYGFYWFEIRPSNIRKECASLIFSNEYGYEDKDNKLVKAYGNCLNSKGLKE